jgi:hypothetical protein
LWGLGGQENSFLEELMGVGQMAMLGRFRRRIGAAAPCRWVFRKFLCQHILGANAADMCLVPLLCCP